MKLSRTMKIDLIWALFGGLITAVITLYCLPSCKPSPSSPIVEVEAGPPIAPLGPCSLLQGVTQNQTVIAVCVTVEEVANLVSTITRLRAADGGHPALSDVALTCFPLAGQPKLFCATPLEIGTGLQEVVKVRGARLMREGGAP